MNAGYGTTCGELFARYSRDTHSLRTSLATFAWGSTESSPTLPASGGMRSGACFRRLAAEPPISVNGSSFCVPTPTSYDATATSANNHYHGLGWRARHGREMDAIGIAWKESDRVTREDLAAEWPTPMASGAQMRQTGGLKKMREKVESGEMAPEEAEAMMGGSLNPIKRPRRMWPTPTTCVDAAEMSPAVLAGVQSGKFEKTTRRAVLIDSMKRAGRLLPTPTANQSGVGKKTRAMMASGNAPNTVSLERIAELTEDELDQYLDTVIHGKPGSDPLLDILPDVGENPYPDEDGFLTADELLEMDELELEAYLAGPAEMGKWMEGPSPEQGHLKWPTPRMSMATRAVRVREDVEKGHKSNLEEVVAVRAGQAAVRTRTGPLWPTPRAMNTGGQPQPATGVGIHQRQRSDLPAMVKGEELMENPAVPSGQLNPEWVEWLMGFPKGWSGLEPLEMPSFRKWLQGHLQPSLFGYTPEQNCTVVPWRDWGFVV